MSEEACLDVLLPLLQLGRNLEQVVIDVFLDVRNSLRIYLLLYLKAIRLALHGRCRNDAAATAGGRVDDNIIGVGEQAYQPLEKRDGLLGRMGFRHSKVSRELHAVHNHLAVVVELRQFVAIEDETILAVANNLHVSLQDLRRVVLSEHEGNAALETVSLAKLLVVELLLPSAEDDHAGCLASLLRLGTEHLGAEVHELGWAEILVGIEELLPGKLALSVLVVAILVPHGIARISINPKVVGWVRYD